MAEKKGFHPAESFFTDTEEEPVTQEIAEEAVPVASDEPAEETEVLISDGDDAQEKSPDIESESTKEPEQTEATEIVVETEDEPALQVFDEAEEVFSEATGEVEAEPCESETPAEIPDEEMPDPVSAALTEYQEDPPTKEFLPEQTAIADPAGETDVPTEFFIPVQENTATDPLSDAQALPSLFPQQRSSEPVTAEPPVPPTTVKRIRKDRKIIFRILRRVLISLVKWVFAIVLAIAVLAAGLIGYLSVTEYDPNYAENAQVGSKQISASYQSAMPLRIVTFNTGYGALGEDADFFMDGGKSVTPESEEYIKENMIGIERILSEIDADIIFLQEVDTDSKRSYEINQWLQYEHDLDNYESRFALNYSCDYVPYPIGFDMIGKVNSGIATYSRFDIYSSTRYSLPCPFSWPTRIANLKRCLLVTRIEISDLVVLDENDEKDHEASPDLVLINVHLDAYDEGEGREAQFRRLRELMEKEYAAGNYVIVGGDFNQTFPDDNNPYPIIHDENFVPGNLPTLSPGWSYGYDMSTPTSRLLNEPYDPQSDGTQFYVIDGFIVSPNVKISSVRTLNKDFVYSDHNPVVMDIELN